MVWGNYILEGQTVDNTKITLEDPNFEPYNEEEHGWHNSEEYKSERIIYDC